MDFESCNSAAQFAIQQSQNTFINPNATPYIEFGLNMLATGHVGPTIRIFDATLPLRFAGFNRVTRKSDKLNMCDMFRPLKVISCSNRKKSNMRYEPCTQISIWRYHKKTCSVSRQSNTAAIVSDNRGKTTWYFCTINVSCDIAYRKKRSHNSC